MKLIKTEDASLSLFSEQYNEQYHSTFGALAESQHIFINAGLKMLTNDTISIFEMGFGTGLNALLTMQYAEQKKISIDYITIEKHPVPIEIINQLNYSDLIDFSACLFKEMHLSDWEKRNQLSPYFSILKHKADLQNFAHQSCYNLIYYDAFSPDIQSQLWTVDIFRTLFAQMNSNGVLLTYSVKGIVKRALKSAGFSIEKIPGPKGKREILRAWKK